MTFQHPANAWRPAIEVSWYQGGAMPQSPMDRVDLSKIEHGAVFKGGKGHHVCSFNNRLIIPSDDNATMTYYNPRSEDQHLAPLGNFQQKWIDACKGGLKTSCDLEYGGDKMEMMLLGLVAYRVGKELDYDGAAGRVTNSGETNEPLRRTYRPGWVLNG